MAKKNILTQGKKAKADGLALANRLEDALALYASVCKTDPADVEAWVKLGVTQRRLGRYGEAETSARRALLHAPAQPLAHHTLGVALQCQGRLDEALAAYQQALRLKPDYPDAHYLMGNTLLAKGRLQEAEACLRRALALRPGHFEALSDLGALLVTRGMVEEAGQLLAFAHRQRPENPEVLANLGSLSEREGKIGEALAHYRQALALQPASPALLAKLAELLERMGQLKEAETVTVRGLALAPCHPALNLVAARLDRRANRLEEGVAKLESVLAQPMAQETLSEIHLLLGQLLDRVGQSDKALSHFLDGKRGIALALDPDGAGRERFMARIDRSLSWLGFDPPKLDASSSPPADDTPVFLIGFPRSGTTLLEQILDSHPALQAVEEKPMVSVMEQAFMAMTGGGSDALHRLDESQVLHLRQHYFQEASRHVKRRPGSMLVDKLPLNIVSVPLIWRVFPEARFILAIRHPCDVALSCLMQSFGHNDAMAGFSSLENISDIYARVMGAWRVYTQRLPIRWHTVRYEDLITRFSEETERLLDFLGVGWDDAVLQHTRHATEREAIKTPSYHQVTQPIYQHARYRWKHYERAFEPVMPILQPFIEYFGYWYVRS